MPETISTETLEAIFDTLPIDLTFVGGTDTVKDKAGKYLGTLEVTQDITEIQKITGEKRLLDEG